MPIRIDIRSLAARDSLEALTQLLHRAYAPQAEQGRNYPAATQSVAQTQQRLAEGQCFVAERQGRIVGTVTVCGPHELRTASSGAGMPAFRDRDTAHFHQLAVAPEFQRQGVGRRLVAACEQWARQHGYRRLALDTAEPATALYRSLGYVDVARVQHEGRSFRSVVMEKPLDQSPLREHLRLLARYNCWATRVLFEHVDALPEADYRRDLGLFFRSIHGTLNHLLLAEHEIWYRRFAEGGSTLTDLGQEIEPDRQALRERLLDGALAWLPLIEVWPESRLLGQLPYRATDGQQRVLPFAAALTHVFNHGTHHRGQVSAALTALGRPCPVLDLAAMLIQENA